MRLQLIVLALAVAIASAASVDSEVDELRDLLAKVKTYLDVSEKKEETRGGTAYTEALTAVDESALAFDPSVSSSYWTGYLNVDWMWSVGTGEYEDCSRVYWQQNIDKKCYLGCQHPMRSNITVVAQDTEATWADIEACVGPLSTYHTGCGFACANYQVRRHPKTNCDLSKCEAFGLGVNCTRCPDIRVNFECAGTAPPRDQCCDYSEDCQKLVGKSGLRSALESVKDMSERRDIAANILHDVQMALRVDDE